MVEPGGSPFHRIFFFFSFLMGDNDFMKILKTKMDTSFS
jgi:hypothetical protein